MGTGNILLACNPAIAPMGGVAMLLSMLHAKETGISSCRLGLWLACTFPFLYLSSKGINTNKLPGLANQEKIVFNNVI